MSVNEMLGHLFTSFMFPPFPTFVCASFYSQRKTLLVLFKNMSVASGARKGFVPSSIFVKIVSRI